MSTERERAEDNDSVSSRRSSPQKSNRRRRRRHFLRVIIGGGILCLLAICCIAWLGFKATSIKSELESAMSLVPQIKDQISERKQAELSGSVEELRFHTAAAHDAASDPVWTLASVVPGLGANFSALAEITRSADDVANLGVTPLVRVLDSLNWNELVPTGSETNLEPLRMAAPNISSAAHAVGLSARRLNEIDDAALLPQIREPLAQARQQLDGVSGVLDASATVAQLAPTMMGGEGQRNYLLMIQNNAEARSTGGIPGALAVLTMDSGKMSLGAQTSATELGSLSPALPLDPDQQSIYSGRLGKYMQDVNLTPDFPSAATTAQQMWERKTGQRVDGVLSLDPVALSYLLEATGPIQLPNDAYTRPAMSTLPAQLTRDNVVKTLLSDVYSEIRSPAVQDKYFAGVAQTIFGALSKGDVDSNALLSGLSRGVEEGRVLVWSSFSNEQSQITKFPVGGSVSGESVAPAQFGVYFNDGTGAKMDYYMKRTVQLVKECAKDGYEQTTVRVRSTNTAPADAATSLPAYVTGDGVYGVPPGSAQTNIVAYGPVQANVETAKVDGQRTDFAPYLHSNRPVGVLAVRLAPGESRTVEFTFGKIVQHTEPNVVVTPTVQDVNDVILPTENPACGE